MKYLYLQRIKLLSCDTQPDPKIFANKLIIASFLHFFLVGKYLKAVNYSPYCSITRPLIDSELQLSDRATFPIESA